MTDTPICGLVASFSSSDDWACAARRAHAQNWELELFAPAADEGLIRNVRPRATRDPVRRWTLGGGILGGCIAFAMTIWMSRDWPLIVGGKPVVSWPPYICIAFELTVLFASLLCMSGFFLRAGLPNLTLSAAYRPEFACDRFGIFLPCGGALQDEMQAWLQAAGAEKIWRVTNAPRGRLDEQSMDRCQKAVTP